MLTLCPSLGGIPSSSSDGICDPIHSQNSEVLGALFTAEDQAVKKHNQLCLPVELFHQIVSYVADDLTLIMLRQVCRSLRSSITKNHLAQFRLKFIKKSTCFSLENKNTCDNWVKLIEQDRWAKMVEQDKTGASHALCFYLQSFSSQGSLHRRNAVWR